MTETQLDDTINDTLPVDLVGDEAYAAKFRYYRALQVGVCGLFLALLGSIAASIWLARRPPIILTIDSDKAGHSEVVRYNPYAYSPREAEIKARLNDWAVYRFRLTKDVARRNFKLNYDYMSTQLASNLMPQESTKLAKILAGNEPEEDVQINNIQFTSIDPHRQPDGVLAAGQARIELTKTINPGSDGQREDWTVSLNWEVDPAAALKRAERDPGFQNLNPLGVFITSFHTDRAFR